MAILSKIKKAVKKVYNSVKNTIGSAVSSYSPTVGAAITGYNAVKSIKNTVSPPSKFTAKVGENVPTFVSGSGSGNYSGFNAPTKSSGGGTNSYGGSGTQYGPVAPTTLRSGSGGGSKSNYDSSSYSADLGDYTAFASSAFMSPAQSQVSLSVNADSIGTGNAAQLTPSAPAAQDYSGQVKEANITGGANTETGMYDTGATTPTEGEDKPKNAYEQYQELMDKLEKQQPDDSRMYEKAQKQAGLLEAQQRITATQNQINGITAKMNQDLLQLRGTAAQEGVTEAVYGGQQAQVTREATIRLLPLQAQLAADQNNLELAQENTDKLYNMYSKEADRSYNFYKEQVATFYQYATAQEKKKLDDIDSQKEFTRSMIKQDSNNQSDLAKEFLSNGNMSAYRAISAIRVPTNVNSPTFDEDYQNYKEDLAAAANKYGATITGAAGSYTPKQLTAITKLNQDVSKNATYSKTTSMRNYGDNVIASLQLGSGVGDIAAINQFQKVIDEGAVTRDQDVKLIQASQSLVNTLKTKIKKLEKGEQLSSDLRTQMRQAVEAMYEKQVEALQKDPYIAAKTKEAELYGITAADTILGELGAFTNNNSSQGQISEEQQLLNAGYTQKQIDELKRAK